MLEVGRLCIKTAGRDAMKHCVIIEIIDEKYVLVDGNTRRKKVNKTHIEPLNKILKIKKGATTKEALEALKVEGIELKKSEKTNSKKAAEKPVKKKVLEQKTTKEAKKVSTKKKEK